YPSPHRHDNSGSATPPQGGSGEDRAKIKIFGPIPAPIYQVRNWYRMRFLITGPERAALQPAVRAWISRVKTPANIRLKIDVNPQSFL
ncbi:MAG: hypothetical protein LBR41_03325, partial [Rickettsiales bacterium]|nr:hypothetical protein [Rickettsiales bacterium]